MDPAKDKRQFLFKKVAEHVRRKLLLDDEAMYSTTDQVTAEKIATTVAEHIPTTGQIIDATACIGGSALAFADIFKSVIAIEKDPIKFEYLRHNILLLGLKDKVKCVQGDCIDECAKHMANGIFIDPPWGGPQYKNKNSLALSLSGMPLSDVCKMLACSTQYIILKVPTNFDYQSFINDTASFMELVVRNSNLRKMCLLIFKVMHKSAQ